MKQVQGGALPEPFQLGLAVGVVQQQGFAAAVAVLHPALDRLAGGEVLQADEADAVVLPDAVVVIRVGEGQGQQALLFEVAFVDAGEAADDDRRAAEETGRQGGVFPAAAFAIVEITDD